MSSIMEVASKTDLPANIKQLKGPRDVLGLAPDDLHTLLKCAYTEMDHVEKALARAEETLAQANQDRRLIAALKNKDPRKKYSDFGVEKTNNFAISPIGMGCLIGGMVVAYISSMIHPILSVLGLALLIYGCVRMYKDMRKRGKNLEHEVEIRLAEADQIYKDAQYAIDNAHAAPLIPSDYRYTLALSTMLKFLENGRANDWATLADKYEEQLHRWTLEQNSNEALEYQRFTALKMEQAAGSAKTAAAASTVSAVINIARLFR